VNDNRRNYKEDRCLGHTTIFVSDVTEVSKVFHSTVAVVRTSYTSKQSYKQMFASYLLSYGKSKEFFKVAYSGSHSEYD
jgi:hypothetical protein